MPISLAKGRQAHLLRAAVILSVALPLAGCGGMSSNRMLDSVHQPVISHAQFTFDVATTTDGLSTPEQHRLSDWFTSMNLRYGDKVSLDDPLASEATRASVAAVAAHHGLLLSEDTPVTQGYVNAGSARVIITRSVARVPSCPQWANAGTNLLNATDVNYGCSVNANLAAMIANPEDLLKGQSSHDVDSMVGSDRAIASYRAGTAVKPSSQSTK